MNEASIAGKIINIIVKGGPGPRGPAATIAVGDVVTGEPETEAIVENVGTPSVAVFKFTLPQGKTGDKFVTLYKVADAQPDAPTGNVPEGWVDYIQDGINWVSHAWMDTHGTLIDTWSAPVRVTTDFVETRYIASDTAPATPTGNDPEGWTIGIPASGVIWTSTARKLATGTVTGVWSEPSKISSDAYEIRYIASDTQPATPTGDSPEGWGLVIPAAGTIWASVSKKLASGKLSGTWSDPAKMSVDYFETRYKASDTTPDIPTGNDPEGWTISIPASGNIWASSVKKLASGTISGAWSDPSKISNDFYQTRYIASETKPATPVGDVPEGWMLSMPTDGTIWASSARKLASGTLVGDWSEPSQVTGPRANTQVTIFKVSEIQPDTPTGNSPEGWSLTPQVGFGINWASVGVLTQAGALVGVWSIPARWTGDVNFAAFELDVATGQLQITTPDLYSGPTFEITVEGNLEVTV